MSRLRWYPPLVVALLIGVQIVVFTSPLTYAGWFIPAAAVVIAILGRVTGLSWDDLGLSPRTMPTGLRYAVVIVVIVAVVAAGAVALPWTRELFHNDSYPDVPAAIYAALVLIPLRTVLAEEVIFRGALLGSLARLTSARVALASGRTVRLLACRIVVGARRAQRRHRRHRRHRTPRRGGRGTDRRGRHGRRRAPPGMAADAQRQPPRPDRTALVGQRDRCDRRGDRLAVELTDQNAALPGRRATRSSGAGRRASGPGSAGRRRRVDRRRRGR